MFGVRRIQMGELNRPGRNLGARGDRARLCDGEDWFLQLDSQHRFVPDWDVLLLDEAARSTSDRPVVATSGTPFFVGESVPADHRPMTMRFIGFNQHDMPSFMASPIDDWETRTRPHRVRFVSGHFSFAPGTFVRDVPSDPGVFPVNESGRF